MFSQSRSPLLLFPQATPIYLRRLLCNYLFHPVWCVMSWRPIAIYPPKHWTNHKIHTGGAAFPGSNQEAIQRRLIVCQMPSEKQFRSLLRGHHTPQRVLRRVLTGCGNCAEARIFLHNAQTLPPAHAHSGQSFLMAPSIQLENAGVFAASENAWSRAVL